MKTVQEYLKIIDRTKLVDTYLKKYPIEYERYDENLTIKEIRSHVENKIQGLIERMSTIPLEEDEDGHLLLIHETYEGKETVLIHIDDLKNNSGKRVETYSYEFEPQSIIAGYYIADLPYTKENIYKLLADVLYEASFFGWQQEDLADHLEKLQEAIDEIETYTEEDLKNWEDFSMDIISEDPIASEYDKKAMKAINECNGYLFDREIEKLKGILK